MAMTMWIHKCAMCVCLLCANVTYVDRLVPIACRSLHTFGHIVTLSVSLFVNDVEYPKQKQSHYGIISTYPDLERWKWIQIVGDMMAHPLLNK